MMMNSTTMQVVRALSFLTLTGVQVAGAFIATPGNGARFMTPPFVVLRVASKDEFFVSDENLFASLDDKSIKDGSNSTAVSEDSMYTDLFARQARLAAGIGKRFVVHTKNGFLNVHSEPTDPFDTENVVGQLKDGEVVTSVGVPDEGWILHDCGGWSVAQWDGFTWLEALQD